MNKHRLCSAHPRYLAAYFFFFLSCSQLKLNHYRQKPFKMLNETLDAIVDDNLKYLFASSIQTPLIFASRPIR